MKRIISILIFVIGGFPAYATNYTLTYIAGAHGAISGTTPQTVAEGANGTTVTATAATGYHFVNWSDSVLTSARRDMTVIADLTTTASFAINTYTLTFTAGAGGTVSGTTPQTVNYGANGTAVTAVANTGYHFVTWSDAVAIATRQFSSVTQNHSITATFAINTYALAYTAGEHGSISGTTPQTVDYGTSGTPITAVPDTDYYFVEWTDGSTQNPRTDSNVTTNVTVTASFSLPYPLTYTAGPHGSISGTTPQSVYYGKSGTPVTAAPDTGYHFVRWSDGTNVPSSASKLSPNGVTRVVGFGDSIMLGISTITSFGNRDGALPKTEELITADGLFTLRAGSNLFNASSVSKTSGVAYDAGSGVFTLTTSAGDTHPRFAVTNNQIPIVAGKYYLLTADVNLTSCTGQTFYLRTAIENASNSILNDGVQSTTDASAVGYRAMSVVISTDDMLTAYPTAAKIAIGASINTTSTSGKIALMKNVTVYELTKGTMVINDGLSGEKATDALARVPAMLAMNPNIVLIGYGTNDIRATFDLPVYLAAMQSIIDSVLDIGALPIVCNMPPIEGNGSVVSWNEALEGLCDTLGVAYLDRYNAVFGSTAYLEDGVHPTRAGYQLIANEMYRVLTGKPDASIPRTDNPRTDTGVTTSVAVTAAFAINGRFLMGWTH